MIVERTKGELERMRKEAAEAGDAEQLASIDRELEMNPPVRYSIDWECMVVLVDGSREFIWASGKTAGEAAVKVTSRFAKAGKMPTMVKAIQSIPAPRWS